MSKTNLLQASREVFRFTVIMVLTLFSQSCIAQPLVRIAVSEHEAARVHSSVLTIDTHSDTPMIMLNRGLDIGTRQTTGRVDLPRMEEGGLDAIFFAAFVPQAPRTEKNYHEAWLLANEMIDTTIAQVTRYSGYSAIALTADDAERLKKEGKRAIYIGVENGFAIGRELSRLEELYNKGARYLTLCHSSNNDICDSSTDRSGSEHSGLSNFGREVVREMNRLGMLIDVSHISDKAFFDVIKTTSAPVIASHSSVRAIANHRRNMSDQMIKALAKNNGVIQICMLDDYIKSPNTSSIRYRKEKELRERYNKTWEAMTEAEKSSYRSELAKIRAEYPKRLPTVSDMVNHIDHVVKLVGIDHVGIGSDFDGGGGLADCNNVSQFPAITYELLSRGYNEEQIAKIWGGNFFRVLREAEVIRHSGNRNDFLSDTPLVGE